MGISSPIIYEGEKVLRKASATRYYRTGDSNGTLWLTDQRLMFKAGFGYQRFFPLSHVVDVHAEKFGLLNIDVIRVELDNGAVEHYSVAGVPEWVETIRSVKLTAPELPIQESPSRAPGKFPLWALISGITVLVICGCIMLTVSALMFFPLLSGGQ